MKGLSVKVLIQVIVLIVFQTTVDAFLGKWFKGLVTQKAHTLLSTVKSDAYGDLLEETLYTLKDFMATGSKEYGIPIMEPLIIDKHFNINNKKWQLKGEFQAEIHNLANYFINNVHADMDLDINLNMTWKDVSMKGHYKIDGLAMNLVPITGSGNHELSFSSLNLVLNPEFEVGGGYIKLIHSGFGYQETNFKILVQGLLNDPKLSKLLSKFLKDLFSSILSRNIDLAKVFNSLFVASFNEADGKGKDVFDLIETAKSLAGVSL